MAVDWWACGRACGRLIGGPVAVGGLACCRRIAWPVAVEGNVGGTKSA